MEEMWNERNTSQGKKADLRKVLAVSASTENQCENIVDSKARKFAYKRCI